MANLAIPICKPCCSRYKTKIALNNGALVEGYQAAHNMSNEEFLAICDTNDDGVFDSSDITTMLQLLSSGIQAGDLLGDGSIAGVPEPTSGLLAGLTLLAVLIAGRTGLMRRYR